MENRKSTPRKLILPIIMIAVALALAAVAVFFVFGNRSRGGEDVPVQGTLVGQDGKELMYYRTDPEHIVADVESGASFVDNELNLKVTSTEVTEDEVAEIVAAHGGTIVGKNEYLGTYHVQFDQAYSLGELDSFAGKIMEDERIEGANANYCMSVNLDGYYPNDKEWASLWEDVPEGKNWGAEAIHAPEMWEYMKEHGTETTNVGVLELGNVDAGHEDLEIEDAFLSRSSAGKAGEHATFVAGVAGATMDNNKGISGVAMDKDLYAASFDDGEKYDVDRGSLTTVNELSVALTYLIAVKGCKVVNASFTSGEVEKDRNDAMIEEISYCLREFVDEGLEFLITKSAGNYSCNLNDYRDVIGFYDVLSMIEEPELKDRIIVVGGAELADGTLRMQSMSNYGDRVDVAAPGGDIQSCVPGGFLKANYAVQSGTSAAAPQVAGIAADIWSVNPELSGKDVKKILCETAEGSLKYEDTRVKYTYPLVNGFAAVKMAADYVQEEETAVSDPEAEKAMYQAYLDILQENQSAIIAYSWQKGYPEQEPSPIAFADILGDGLPEMLVIQALMDNDYGYIWQTELRIYTYRDGAAVLAYSDLWDAAAGGGFYYNLFQVEGEKNLYAWTSTGDEHWDYYYLKFVENAQNYIEEQEIMHKSSGPDVNYTTTINEFYEGGAEISEEEFNARKRELAGKVSHFLIQSQTDLMDDSMAGKMVEEMTYGEAVAYLQSFLPENAAAAAEEYVFPESDSRYLTDADVAGMSAEQIRIGKNEIYARHGRMFQDQGLQDHFNGCSWYSGTVSPDAFSESVLNEFEKANATFLSAKQDAMASGRETAAGALDSYLGEWNYNGEDQLIIRETNGNSMNFSLWFYRTATIEVSDGSISGNVVTFTDPAAGVSGTLTLEGDQVTVQITSGAEAYDFIRDIRGPVAFGR